MITYKQKYSVLNISETDPEVWWNALDRWDHVSVGNISIHFGMMTDEYKWKCNVPYNTLQTKQKKMVDYILTQKDTLRTMFRV